MRKILLVTVSCGLVVTALLAMVRPTSSPPTDATTMRARILACSPTGARGLTGGFEANPVMACLQDLLLATVLDRDIDELDAALAQLESEMPQFTQLCHTVMHAVGRQAVLTAGSVAERIAESRGATCVFGYGHGVLEGFAETTPTAQEFRVVVESCKALLADEEADPKAGGLCIDGAGHAAWEATEDIAGAAALCDLFQETDRRLCTIGVLMQIYAPVNESARPLEQRRALLTRASEELPAMCDAWPGSADGRAGCATGAGYIYTRSAHILATRLQGNITDLDALRREVAPATAEAMRACEQRTGDDAALCLAEIRRQVPVVAYRDDALNAAMCALLYPESPGCRLRNGPTGLAEVVAAS